MPHGYFIHVQIKRQKHIAYIAYDIIATVYMLYLVSSRHGVP